MSSLARSDLFGCSESLEGYVCLREHLSRQSLTLYARQKTNRCMKTVRLHSLLLAFVLLGCAGIPDTSDARFDDIREAVFRYQFDHATPNHRENAVYFLAVADSESKAKGSWPLPLGDRKHDPSDGLMARFNDQRPPVQKNSAMHSRAMRL